MLRLTDSASDPCYYLVITYPCAFEVIIKICGLVRSKSRNGVQPAGMENNSVGGFGAHPLLPTHEQNMRLGYGVGNPQYSFLNFIFCGFKCSKYELLASVLKI